MSTKIEIAEQAEDSNAPAATHAGAAKKILATTRFSNVSFEPPVTHDMIRSLFDPTVKKSFLECCITLTIILNFVLSYYLVKWFGISFTKKFYLFQYVIWRIGYNLGIGIILHNQSHYETLTNYAKTQKLFDKKNSKGSLAKFLQFEIKSKMDASYDMEKYPEELNVWLMFRQFVDLILMQDFSTYAIYVYLSCPSTLVEIINWKTLLGLAMTLFNVWVKIDAHRVVKDFAWYWGDFFFLQDSELTFDGVFNISPHPMYSIGYMGYYGVSLICGDYRVLLVSIWGHLLQFLFLKYVETPHIEKIYGTDSGRDSQINSTIDDLITKENYDYSRPLISTGLFFENFQYLRFTDYFTLSTVIVLSSWFWITKPTDIFMFHFALVTKIVTWLGTSMILYQQSTRKWFTKLFLKNGYTQIYSYQQWQFIYSFSSSVSNTLLTLQTVGKLRSYYPNLEYSQIIFGLLLCAVQIWCNTETRHAISDFGWFYGDFFLTNYITTRKLTSHGIYRYLNNPEAILGVAGIWGTVLMTNFCMSNICLACLWTLTNFIFVKFIEQPHVAKVYGSDIRVSGVQKSLLASKPIRLISTIVDKMGDKMMKAITRLDFDSDSESDDVSSRKQITSSKSKLGFKAENKLAPNSEFEIENSNGNIELSNSITIKWKLPASLYNDRDWIGLYNVLETGSDRIYTKVPSMGHWSATSKKGYPNNKVNSDSVIEIKKSSSSVRGKVVFDPDLLFYKPGIYEFRYHHENSHECLLISDPFQLSFPAMEADSQENIKKCLIEFLSTVGSVQNGRFHEQHNKNFDYRAFIKLIKDSLGVELSVDYINRFNGDIDVISSRIYEIKKVLDNLF